MEQQKKYWVNNQVCVVRSKKQKRCCKTCLKWRNAVKWKAIFCAILYISLCLRFSIRFSNTFFICLHFLNSKCLLNPWYENSVLNLMLRKTWHSNICVSMLMSVNVQLQLAFYCLPWAGKNTSSCVFGLKGVPGFDNRCSPDSDVWRVRIWYTVRPFGWGEASKNTGFSEPWASLEQQNEGKLFCGFMHEVANKH